MLLRALSVMLSHGADSAVQTGQAPQPRRAELTLVLDDDAGTALRIAWFGAASQEEIETLVRRKVDSTFGSSVTFSLQDEHGADVVLSHTLPDGLRLRVVRHEANAAAAAAGAGGVGGKRKRDVAHDTPATTPPVEPRGGAAARLLGEPNRARSALPDPSEEQQAVISVVKEGKCAAVASVAGSGKTTLMLQIARELPVGRHALIVTYNRVRSLLEIARNIFQSLALTSRLRAGAEGRLRTAHQAARHCRSRPVLHCSRARHEVVRKRLTTISSIGS